MAGARGLGASKRFDAAEIAITAKSKLASFCWPCKGIVHGQERQKSAAHAPQERAVLQALCPALLLDGPHDMPSEEFQRTLGDALIEKNAHALKRPLRQAGPALPQPSGSLVLARPREALRPSSPTGSSGLAKPGGSSIKPASWTMAAMTRWSARALFKAPLWAIATGDRHATIGMCLETEENWARGAALRRPGGFGGRGGPRRSHWRPAGFERGRRSHEDCPSKDSL